MSNKGPLKRISGENAAIAEQVFTAAVAMLLPEKTMARFVEEQIKTIQWLRQKGMSWTQIKNVLAEIGINLNESTIRSYYSRATSKNKKEAKKSARSLTSNLRP